MMVKPTFKSLKVYQDLEHFIECKSSHAGNELNLNLNSNSNYVLIPPFFHIEVFFSVYLQFSGNNY